MTLDDLLGSPNLVWTIAIILGLAIPVLLTYLARNFEISEITPSPPWVKLTRKPRTSSEAIQHNLPQPEYGHFIGRQNELRQVTQLLRPYPDSIHAIVTIDGSGGIGKSALALEVAHRYLQGDRLKLSSKERFTAIVWVSAKNTVLTADGILSRRQAFRSLQDIYSAIAVTLGHDNFPQLPLNEQSELVKKVLSQKRTLLIIDNLETVDDETVMSFIKELPAPTKAIITTRHRIDVAYPIRLEGLEWKDAEALIIEECKKKVVSLTEDEKRQLHNYTGGVPLAMVWSIAQIGYGYSLDSILNRLKNPASDVSLFCFETVIEKIRHKPSFRLITALSLFTDGASRERLGYLSGLSEVERDDGLVELEKLSLINRRGAFFTMLPLTREYVLAELEIAKDIKNYLMYRLTLVPFSEIAPQPSDWWQKKSISELRVPIGKRVDGELVEFTLGQSSGNIHSLIVGVTGSGKTNFINVMLINFALNYPPDELNLWVIDYKGSEVGYEFLEKIPYKAKLAVGIEASEILNVFEELDEEIQQRLELLRMNNTSSFDEYRIRAERSIPRILVFIEEPQIIKDDYLANQQLVKFVRRSRAAGVHFVFSAQSVSTIDHQIYQNVSSQYVLRSSSQDAEYILGGRSQVARDLRVGEVVFKDFSSDRLVRFQSAYLSASDMSYYTQQINQLAKSRGHRAG